MCEIIRVFSPVGMWCVVVLGASHHRKCSNWEKPACINSNSCGMYTCMRHMSWKKFEGISPKPVRKCDKNVSHPTTAVNNELRRSAGNNSPQKYNKPRHVRSS